MSYGIVTEVRAGDSDAAEYETTVAARPIPDSAGAATVTARQIEEARPASADELLGILPGVEIVQHGSEGKGHQILLRGFDAAHGSDVEVTFAGISLNEPSHVHGTGYLDLYGIIPEVIARMDVFRGPFLPGQGNFATAGTIAFSPGVPDGWGPFVSRLEAGVRGKARAVVMAAPSSPSRFIAAEAVTDRGFAQNRRARRAVLMGQIDRRLRRGAVLSALMSAQTARFETPGAMALSAVNDGTRGFYDSRDPAGQGLSDRLLGRLGWQRDNERTDAELFAYGMARRFSLTENFTGRLQYSDEGDRRTQAQQGGTAGLSALVDHSFDRRIRLAWRSGAGWRMDAFHQKETQVDDTGHPWLTNRSNRAVLHSLHAFTGLRISPWDKLALFPSIRLDMAFFDVADRRTDKQDSAIFVVPSPRMTIALPLHRAITLFADYGRGFRMPEARSILAPEPSSVEDVALSRYEGGAPEPSVADAVEAGAEVTPLSRLSFKVTGFFVWMEREMLFDHVSNMNIEQDGTTRLGVELEAAFAPLSWLRLEADATAVRARFRRSGHPVPGAPSAMGNARLRAGEDRGPHGSAEVFWMGRRNLAHGASVQGYGVLNLDAGWRFKRYDITAVLDNALNARVMEGAYHFASQFGDEPRSVIPEIQYVAGPPLSLRVVFTLYL